jgi:hypothetical protein
MKHMFRIIVTILVIGLYVTGCASHQNVKTAQVKPESIEHGWNGLEWGTTISDAKLKFPCCHFRKGELGCDGTNKAHNFCELHVYPLYGFNQNGRFCTLILVPEKGDRHRLKDCILSMFNCRNEPTNNLCLIGQLTVEVNDSLKIITIKNKLYDN